MKTKFAVLNIIIWVALFALKGAIAQGTWMQKADYPGAGERSAASFSIATKCYIISGYGDAVRTRDFWEWDQTTNVWTRKADYPGDLKIGVVSFSIGTKGYIGTGADYGVNGESNQFWEYDTSTDTWTQKASLPSSGRSYAVGFSIGTKGYIGTGFNDNLLGYNDFWEWDQETNIWTQKADFGGSSRGQAVGFSIGNKGYIGTGDNGFDTVFKDFWEWDQATNVWTQKADFGGAGRLGAIGFSIGNKGYIGIGCDFFAPPYIDFWEWDQETNVWTQKANYERIARLEAVGFSIGNKGYIGLGNDYSGENFFVDFWEYDPSDVTYPHTDIIPNGSTVKKLSSNQFNLAEGPVWYRDSVLLFTSGDLRKIYSYDPIENQFRVFHSRIEANGLTCDMNGNLLTCEWRIVMRDKAGNAIKLWPGSFNGKAFNGPNDLIADNKGGIYFTDPIFFATPIQDKEAVYYIDPTGTVKRIIDDLQKPNGVILSPDGKKLYVADSNTTYVYSYDVASDGSVSNKSIFAELQTVNGLIMGGDGMAIDIYGNLYIATEMGIQIFSAAGTALTTIEVPEPSLNCDFGGKDFKTLYITGLNNLFAIDLNYPGYTVSRKNMTDTKNPIPAQALIELYPNPVTGMLYVHHNLGKLRSIDLITIEGKKASLSFTKQDEADFRINTQNLIPGLYLLRLVHQQGNTTMKFLKK